ncbi:hypothetical protein C8Q76DRAFT_792582 [Earliella scabrosa]|nr:hypothetical protein C8Q76DRAFT_792582 [Earliella scabrosa]
MRAVSPNDDSVSFRMQIRSSTLRQAYAPYLQCAHIPIRSTFASLPYGRMWRDTCALLHSRSLLLLRHRSPLPGSSRSRRPHVEVVQLRSKPPVQLTGLGPRDSLRLEAGMCLYGQDLDQDTTPVEAGLSWVIEGAKIFCEEQVGTVTSWIPPPSLGKNITMVYVSSGSHKKGTALVVNVRNKLRPATVVPMRFVPTRYFRG